MKLNRKPAKAEKATDTNAITPKNFDGGISYVGNKVPTASIRKEAVGLTIPKKFAEKGFLIVHGSKPGLLVHPVQHNGDVYARHDNGKTVYGSLNAINGLKHKGFHAEFVDAAGLKKLAQKVMKGAVIKRQSDKHEFRVAFLNHPQELYVAAIAFTKDGKGIVLNTEPPRPCNMKHKSVRFEPGADIEKSEISTKLAKVSIAA